ncbi:GAF and ANTAR domain-containing protein [Actinosynnema sp. NPDC047251]|nr:GAF and ANTAR domain-containing protein [Saccharothrix espanaensis]
MDEVRETAAAVIEFTLSLHPDEPVGVLLGRVASRVTHLVEGADEVSVTLYDHGVPGTVTCTSESALLLDKAQYSVEDGPCLRAAREQTVIRTRLDAEAGRWPQLAETAVELGIRTALSCPLFLPDDGAAQHRHAEARRLSGALNVWSSQADAFDPVRTALVAVFTSAMSAIILTAAHWSHAHAQARQLVTALETRDIIATAKGIVMARLGFTAPDAFRWMTEVSQRTNHKVRDLAALIVTDPDAILARPGNQVP